METPNLYTLRIQIRSGEQVVDEYNTPFGVRTAVFDKDKGFLLNGRQVKLNGVCLHHDGGGVGAAVPEALWVRRLKILKDMGCNAIRTSHNPFAPEFLDLCDQMGFLVMDEVFDEWEQGKRPQSYHVHFKQEWQRDLLDFIRRDRNHPSVVIWSAGNEVGDQTSARGPEILRAILDIFHREDPTRLVTVACDRIAAEPRATPDSFLNLLDVVGYNYVDRWRDRTNLYFSIDRARHPEWRFIGTESSSMSGSRGDYAYHFQRPTTVPALPASTRPATQDADVPEWHMTPHPGSRRMPLPRLSRNIDVEGLWKFVRNHDYVSGDFMWTGIDYLGEARWPNKVATYGVIDTCGFPKDGFYFYQSQWTNRPVLHLFPHWNLPNRKGEFIPVTAYTNCETVELFLNGKSVGIKGYEFPRDGMR